MKLHFTLLIAVLIAIGTPIAAQTIHDIEAGGGGSGNPDPYYAPQFITIEIGDIVRWTNSGGTHNVDGTTETYPDNPEGFTNGDPDNDLWVFEHTFTIAGSYGFECSAFDHNETQFGTVTVIDSSVGISDFTELTLDIYPNPSSDFLNVFTEDAIQVVEILSTDLKVIESVSVSGLERGVRIDLSHLSEGSYFLHVRTDSGKAIRRFLKN